MPGRSRAQVRAARSKVFPRPVRHPRGARGPGQRPDRAGLIGAPSSTGTPTRGKATHPPRMQGGADSLRMTGPAPSGRDSPPLAPGGGSVLRRDRTSPEIRARGPSRRRPRRFLPSFTWRERGLLLLCADGIESARAAPLPSDPETPRRFKVAAVRSILARRARS
jgi:hypothetical protein